MSKSNCPICGNYAEVFPTKDFEEIVPYDCLNCGRFKLTTTAKKILGKEPFSNLRTRAAIAYAIRRRQVVDGAFSEITRDVINSLAKADFLPSVSEQLDNLIRWLGQNLIGPGESVIVSAASHQAIIGAVTPSGVDFILEGLLSRQLIDGHLSEALNEDGLGGSITLTVEGWNRFAEIENGEATGTTAFMAMSFNNADLDFIVDEFMRHAVEQTGFKLLVLRDNPKAGLIDDRLRVEINAARFVIADLSDANNGAYWEAGYAEGRGKPVIYICNQEVFDDPKIRPHFDTNHHLTVSWDLTNLEKFATELKATIRATVPDARQSD